MTYRTWTPPGTSAAAGLADTPLVDAPTTPAPQPLPAAASAPAAPLDDSIPHTPALPEGVHLVLEQALRGDGTTGDNLCVLVGTVRLRHARDKRRTWYALGIEEVLTGTGALQRDELHLPLQLSPALLSRCPALVEDGQRVQVVGMLQNQQRYDARFATDPWDPGRPTWDIRLDVVALSEAPADTPDYTSVQLRGTVEQVRYQQVPIGMDGRTRLVAHTAAVMLRNTIFVQSAAPTGRGRYRSTTVLPLQVSLEDPTSEVYALLRPGNSVAVEGRLVTYRVRRNAQRDPRLQEVAEGLEPRARRALLNPVRWTIDVGYVVLEAGTPLSADEVAAAMDAQERQRAAQREAQRHNQQQPRPPVDPLAALEAATTTALQQRQVASSDESVAEDAPPATTRIRPRRRPAPADAAVTAADGQAAGDQAAAADHDSVEPGEGADGAV